MARTILALALLLALAGCGDDAAGPVGPDPGPLDGQDLVFEGVTGRGPLLFRAAADGTGEAVLLGSGLAGSRPRVNPGSGFDIVVVSTDGEVVARIERPGDDFNPAWIERR